MTLRKWTFSATGSGLPIATEDDKGTWVRVSDYSDAYRLGFSAGQAALKDVGALVVIDSPELAQLRDALRQAHAIIAALALSQETDRSGPDKAKPVRKSGK